ncbi:MAG: C-GCAxxG-C-C family protein [Prevotella sp.]|nr:C-GCAxxG-C-C family protein [Bacteroides sp.]MCM1367071.1 C-GCAxxG-C-C family protein [Prevotella sp.]MCM1437547.1 C-GCAxxG-C-C family protein [Prevotella sp.]
MTLDERKDMAMSLRLQGYNCAQSVLLAFADVLPVKRDSLAALSAPLGAGVACGEICGVPNAMAIAIGLYLNNSSPKGKIDGMKRVKPLLNIFAEANGDIRCADLKGVPGKAPCDQLILQGVEILHNNLFNSEESLHN